MAQRHEIVRLHRPSLAAMSSSWALSSARCQAMQQVFLRWADVSPFAELSTIIAGEVEIGGSDVRRLGGKGL